MQPAIKSVAAIAILLLSAGLFGGAHGTIEVARAGGGIEALRSRNGLVEEKSLKAATVQDVDLLTEGGWFTFFFGAAGTAAAYNFRFDYSGFVRITLADAYCVGDSFDLIKDGAYLLSTPFVASDNCQHWVDNPDATLYDPTFSSSQFMLPGPFNLTIKAHDSPYGGGVAFIRAKKHVGTCPSAVAPFTLITDPLGGRGEAQAACESIGKKLAHIRPENALAAAKTLNQCGYGDLAWLGQLSIAAKEKSLLAADPLGCLAFTSSPPGDPTVEVVKCDTALPTLCEA